MKIKLGYSSIELFDDIVWTTFLDGAKCPATWHTIPHYYVISHRLGYQDNIKSYCFEHEFCHLFIEEKLHNRPSQVLWALAHNSQLKGNEAVYEEIVAQTFQRWLRSNERPIVSGINWDKLKYEALELLGK